MGAKKTYQHKYIRTEEADHVSSSSVPELLNEIIWFQILPRLPAKSLMRFKCVCKSWSSFITGRDFPPIYRNFNRNRSKYTVLLVNVFDQKTGLEHLLSVQVNRTSPSNDCATNLLTLHDGFRLRNDYQCTNGLACFRLSHTGKAFDDGIHIFNPSTRKSVTLSPPSPTYFRDLVTHQLREVTSEPYVFEANYFTDKVCYHLGFSPPTNEYKVVEVHMYRDFGLRSPPFQFQTFTLRTLEGTTTSGSNSWKRVKAHPAGVGLPFDPFRSADVIVFHTRSVCVHGALHWLHKSYNIIVVFDLGDERFRVIPLPTNPTHGRIVEVDGCLALINFDRRLGYNAMDLWILKDYQSRVWVKEITLSIDLLRKYGYPTSDICTLHTGELLLVHPSESSSLSLHLYDRESESFRTSKIVLPRGVSLQSATWGEFTSCDESITPLRLSESS